MAFDREAALAAGYSEQEIDEFLRANVQARRREPVASEVGEIPDSTTVVPEVEQTSSNTATGAGALAMGAAAAGVPVLVYKGAKSIFSPAAKAGAELAQRGVTAAENIGKTMAETEGRVAANQAARAAQAVRPVAPTPTYNVPTGGIPQASMPVPGQVPVAPAQPAMPAQAANAARGAAQAAQPGNWMAQALQMAKQYAPAMARVGAGLGAATYSGGLNTNEQAELNRRRAMELEQARRLGWIR